MNEKNDAIRDARTLGVPKMLLLGLQHMFAMFGATILVPMLVNSYFGVDNAMSIQVTLVCAGLGTLFFHLCSKLKVPAFLGSSFAFLGGYATVANLNTGIFAAMEPAEKAQYAAGGIVVAGLFVSGTCIDYQAGGRKEGYALPASGCDRTDYYLYRIKPGTVSSQQRIQQLAVSLNCTCSHYYFQHLGQGNV